MSKGQLHEGFSEHGEEKQASEKSLGIVFACVCAIISVLGFYFHSGHGIYWLTAAALFLFCAYVCPHVLKPLNRFWHGLGMVLFMVVNPLVMGIIFFGVVTPTGLLMRLFKKDPLKLKLDKNAESYWEIRNPPGPAGRDMSNQF